MSRETKIQTKILFEDEVKTPEALFSPTILPAPTVFTGQRLRGVAVVSQYGTQRPVFDAVQLTLKGKVKNVVRQADGLCWESKKPLILMSCVKVPDDFKTVPLEGYNAVTQGIEFFFDIPKSITVPTYEKQLINQLPPSIRVVKTTHSTDWPEHCRAAIAGRCDVTYHVEVRISRGGKIVCETCREIIVMPTTETPPPLDPEDLKYEYRLFAASSLGSFWKPKKSTSITVSSEEPRPLVFPSLKGYCTAMNTEVLLNFRARKMCDGEKTFLEPPVIECEVKITLEAITYFLEHEKEQVMSIAETWRSPFAILKRKRFKTQTRNLKLEGWKRGNDSAFDSSRAIEWKTTASLMTLIPDDVSRLPSFFSTLVSRRYAFNVQIVFGTKLGVSNKSVHLRIPLQIVHAPVGKHPDGPSEFEFEDDLKAPAYVP